ncbi:MAG: PAS domain-containing protein, partial [Verrucomicrobia bacterium]|nr:PAS domain-containing protein [Verrucomicrobiota bacterium]
MWWWFALLAVVAALAIHLAWWRRCRQLRDAWAHEREAAAASRARHQQGLARDQAQLAALFDSMVEGVLLLDANGRIRLVNQALEKLFGLTGDIRGATIMEAFRWHALQELVRRAAAEPPVVEVELEPPGLKDRCLQVNATTVGGRAGQPPEIILVFHDLTRLKQ